MMNKQQVIAAFREMMAESKIPRTDKPAWSQAWNDYTDALHKSRQITAKQYDTWTNPF